jgi:hypothetical protein
MALVTRDELKLTLGIGDLYSNDVLDQVIGTSTNVILSLLVRDRHFIDQACCSVSLDRRRPALASGSAPSSRTTSASAPPSASASSPGRTGPAGSSQSSNSKATGSSSPNPRPRGPPA